MTPRAARPPPGFTLLELLVVIALLALLAAFLFPVFAMVRAAAGSAACLSNMRQISMAQRLYIDDWNEQFPMWWSYDPNGRLAPYTFWTETFQPYLKGRDVLRCPAFAWSPEGEAEGERLADYALLTWGPGGTGSASDPYWQWAGPPLSLSAVRRPSETFNLVDGYTTTEITRGLYARHRDGMNLGFVDGHARWMPRASTLAVLRDTVGSYYRFIAADR